MKIKTNKVYRSLVNNEHKIIAHQGGTRSGKTYNILLWIIFDYCARNEGKTITICRKTFPSLRATVMRDFLDILKSYNIYSEADHNKSNSEYNLKNNLVEFISLDVPQKVRGRKRQLLYINEANEIIKEDWNQLIFRTEEQVILDYNPSDEYHFIYDDVLTRKDCDFYITTYKDNPFLDPKIKTEIERLKETDETYWQIYGLGQKGISKATIFNFSESKIPESAQFLSYGMDFGYTNDPTTLVEVYRDQDTLYAKELLYRTHMTTQDINKFLRESNINGVIYCDSAEPRLIDELRRMGNPVRPTLKGRDSIQAGIDVLKRYKLKIEGDHFIQEMRNYKWVEDKTGKLTNIPIDKNNHLIDALRYATYNVLSKPNYGKYAIR
jgi:phage terminase large subunit